MQEKTEYSEAKTGNMLKFMNLNQEHYFPRMNPNVVVCLAVNKINFYINLIVICTCIVMLLLHNNMLDTLRGMPSHMHNILYEMIIIQIALSFVLCSISDILKLCYALYVVCFTF